MFDLSEDVSIVTGGNGGLGLAFGRGLVKAGAKVAVWGRNEEKNAAAVAELRELGGDAEAYACDVTDDDQIAAAFSATIERFGKVDSCFANAGGGGFRGMSHMTSNEDWQGTIDLNLTSVVKTWRPVTEHLMARKSGGRLIVTSSAAALLGFGGAAGYSATKAAVIGLVQALAVELGQFGIRVNAVLPGFIETEMSLNTPQVFQDACRRRSAIGRIGTLEDMEGIAVFLASKESDFSDRPGHRHGRWPHHPPALAPRGAPRMAGDSEPVTGECTGQCLCGNLAFQFELPTLWCSHCHCAMCQQAHGAAFVTWVGVDEKGFEVTKGAPRWYSSSAEAERGFCSDCGSTLFFRSTKWPGEIHIVRSNIAGGIDRRPSVHVGWESHVDWIEVNDGLPKHHTKVSDGS